MAEGLLRHLGEDYVEVQSAGTDATKICPEAIDVMREIGIDISDQHSKTLDSFVEKQFDYVITVCDHANETCPIFPGAVNRWHWSIEDPSKTTGSEAEKIAAYRKARDELKSRIEVDLLPEILKTL